MKSLKKLYLVIHPLLNFMIYMIYCIIFITNNIATYKAYLDRDPGQIQLNRPNKYNFIKTLLHRSLF